MPKFNEVMGNLDAKIEEEEAPTIQEKPKPKAERHPVSVYSDKHRHIPMTKTRYVKEGGKWKQVGEPEKSIISREFANNVLAKEGLPFESSHRHSKKDRFGHMNKYDTFSSVSPDRTERSVWNVDFAKGDENYRKLQKKSFYDRMRYKKKKEALKQQKIEGDK